MGWHFIDLLIIKPGFKGLTRISHVEGRLVVYDRQFVDFEDLHIARHGHSSLSYAQISWIVAACLVYLLLSPAYIDFKQLEQKQLAKKQKRLTILPLAAFWL